MGHQTDPKHHDVGETINQWHFLPVLNLNLNLDLLSKSSSGTIEKVTLSIRFRRFRFILAVA